jgi:phenylpropionate dioxygenase-like ring-hydroxylating dioxygenase large terminal subunit
LPSCFSLDLQSTAFKEYITKSVYNTMVSELLHYFTFGTSAAKLDTPEKEVPVRALPASWYTSRAMYEMERRAIFTRRWLFMTHSSRVKNSGDWLRYTVAGYDFIITKDRQGNTNAFHNVCRHRAYPVVEREGSGNAKILSCRYHGWSYGLNGKLAKAPGYLNLQFDSEKNGLFPIHTHIDRNGFIWVNMDAREIPEVSFEEHFEYVDIQQRYIDSSINFDDYELDHTYELDGKAIRLLVVGHNEA